MATRVVSGDRRVGESTVRRIKRRMWRERSAYLFILPAVLVFSLFTFGAFVFAVWLTFRRWSIIEPEKPYVGTQNYEDMLQDERFGQAIFNTVYFTGASVPLGMLIGLGLALLLNQPLRGRALLRTAYYLPVITPFVVAAIIWKWLYNADFGLFNYYLLQTKLIDEPLLWLSDKDLAMPAVILMTVWAGVGFSMVVYLAGLQAIPEELYESSKLDGAGTLRRLWHITLPLLRPSTVFLAVLGIIGSLQVFTQIFVMTSGGPVNRTTTMVYYMYQWGFKYYDLGYASTLAIALFVMLLIFSAVQLRILRQADL
jgi:multiple sugar transport system permease protein